MGGVDADGGICLGLIKRYCLEGNTLCSFTERYQRFRATQFLTI